MLRLLGLSPGGHTRWRGDTYFELWVADSPVAMEESLRGFADQGYGARITAGFCWP